MKNAIKAIRRVSGRKAGLLSGLLALVAAATVITFPSAAWADVTYRGLYRNWATGRCLDSDWNGNAYALGCNFGNFQNWTIDHVDSQTGPNANILGYKITDNQTGRCLDSNWDGYVYTLPCNGGDYQIWWMYGYGYDNRHQAWQDKATGRMLHDFTDNPQFGRLTTIAVQNPWWCDGYGQWSPGF